MPVYFYAMDQVMLTNPASVILGTWTQNRKINK